MNIDHLRVSQSADLLKSLGSYTRLQIICFLCNNGPTSVGKLSSQLDLEQSSISHQLARLRREHLVTTTRQGAEIYYEIAKNKQATLARDLIKKCGCLNN